MPLFRNNSPLIFYTQRTHMNPVKFPLKQNDNNADIVNLKEALLLLIDKQHINLLQGPAFVKRWKLEQGYGEATKVIIETFQKANNMLPSGVVDESTASSLNKILKEIG